MPVEEDLLDLVANHELVASTVVGRATAALSAPLSNFQGWYDRQAIRRLSEMLGGMLSGFERVAARNADAYMARAISATTGRSYFPTGARRTELGRRGVDNAAVIGRISNAYRWRQAELDKELMGTAGSGEPLKAWVEPRQAAIDKLGQIVGTNLQMAQRSQMLTTMEGAEEVTFYRRIIHPELAEEGTCGLCIAASDRRYGKKDLMAIHPGCHCTVLGGTRKFDPHTINEIDFSQLYNDAGGSTAAEDLRQTRYRVDEHGEIGPVLRPEGEPIRTEKQALRTVTQTSSKKKTPDQQVANLVRRRDSMLDAYHQVLKDHGTEEDWAPTLERMRGRLTKLNTEINASRGDGPKLTEQELFAPRIDNSPKLTDLPKLPKNRSDDVREHVISTNPLYDPKSGSYSVNCVHTVQANEMRRRGYDVVATALPDDLVREGGRSAQAALTGAWTPKRRFTETNKVGAKRVAGNWPVGARGWVVVRWKSGRTSHIFSVENTADGLVWTDPQRGIRIDPDEYFDRAFEDIKIVRVDDLTPTDSLAAFVRPTSDDERALSAERVADENFAGHFATEDLQQVAAIDAGGLQEVRESLQLQAEDLRAQYWARYEADPDADREALIVRARALDEAARDTPENLVIKIAREEERISLLVADGEVLPSAVWEEVNEGRVRIAAFRQALGEMRLRVAGDRLRAQVAKLRATLRAPIAAKWSTEVRREVLVRIAALVEAADAAREKLVAMIDREKQIIRNVSPGVQQRVDAVIRLDVFEQALRQWDKPASVNPWAGVS